MGNISEQKLAMAEYFRVFHGIFSAHLSPEILNKQNIKETVCKSNIWGPFYIPKREGLVGGYRIRKYYVIKKIYINPNPNSLFRNV